MKTGVEFFEKTKYEYAVQSDQQKKMEQPSVEKDYDKNLPVVELPEVSTINVKEYDLRKAIENRKSVRQYTEEKISLEELSYMLWATQGVMGKSPNGKSIRRTVPSAGSRHAFETYILVNKVEGLKSGLYRYISLEHKLVQLNIEEDIADKVVEVCLEQSFIKTSAVTFIWSAVPYRMSWRYDERGYRYLLIDAGHVCENLYLVAETLNCGVCAIDAYDDNSFNKLLNFDGENEFVIYLATLGKK